MVDSKVTKIGSGGRLYRDARSAEDGEPAREPIKAAAKPIPDAATPLRQRPLKPEPSTVKPMMEPAAEPKRDWSELISTLLEILGMTLLSFGLGMWHPWVGIAVAGTCLIILGVAQGLGIGKSQ